VGVLVFYVYFVLYVLNPTTCLKKWDREVLRD